MAVALVTGAASGIGRAAALRFARAGCKVVVTDIDDEQGSETCASVIAQGGQATYIHVDVADEAQVASMMHQVRAEFGRLDYAHNNAGIEGTRAPIDSYPTDVFDRVMAVNCRGAWLCIKHEVPLMLKSSNNGAIAMTSSTAGLRGMPEFSAYSASKHAMIGIARSVALEYAGRIRVNYVCPATTDTAMVARFARQWPEWQAATNASYPIGRIATAEEVADAVVWACMSATFMTGQAIVLDGGSLA